MKPKKLILLLSSICFYSLINAQQGGPPQGQPQNQDADNIQPTGYISLNFGFSTPEGSFANSTGSNYGGYALPGGAFHLSAGIPINHSNFGVAFMLGTYSNQYDLNTYSNNNSDYAIYPDQNYYSETSLMCGFYATCPIGRFSIDGRLMVGALLNSLPEQNYGYNDAEGDSYEYDLQPSNSTSLAVDAGFDVRYLIARFGRHRLCAMVNVDYLYSSIPYNTQQNIYEVPATGPNAGYQVQLIPSPTYSGSFPLQLLNVTFGLGYQF